MIYTEEELRRWWAGLAEARRQEILQTMVQRAPSPEFSEFAMSLRRRWDSAGDLSYKQLTSIKKWDR